MRTDVVPERRAGIVAIELLFAVATGLIDLQPLRVCLGCRVAHRGRQPDVGHEPQSGRVHRLQRLLHEVAPAQLRVGRVVAGGKECV